MTKRRVLHIISSLGNGGAEKILVDLVTNQKELNHVIVSLKSNGYYYKHLIDSGIKVYELGMDKVNFIWKIIKLIQVIMHEQPGAIQGWLYHGNILAVICKIFHNAPILWSIHSTDVKRGIYSFSVRLLNKLCAYLSSIPAFIIFVSSSSLATHLSYGYKNKHMTVIHNGYDYNKFYYDKLLRELTRNSLAITTETFVIGCIGRFNPAKDHGNFFAAIAQIKNELSDFMIILAGAQIDETNNELVQLIQSYNLQSEVKLLGVRSDMCAIYNALDLLVLSSCSESFPNVLVEAMCCQVPCITTDAGDARKILANDKFVAPTRRPDLLSQLIVLAKNLSKDERKYLGVQFRERIIEEYSLGKMLNNYSTIYSIVLN